MYVSTLYVKIDELKLTVAVEEDADVVTAIHAFNITKRRIRA